MAITLKDLLAGQARLSEQEKMAGSKERMSMAEFRQITAAGGTNVMAEELKKHTGLLKVIADKKETTKKGPDETAKAEVDQEARAVEENKVKLLDKIEQNTRKVAEKKDKEEKKEEDGTSLPLIIAGIAAALGSLAGVVSAYVKTVKLFAEALTPQFIKTKISGALENIGKFFAEVFTKIRTALKAKIDQVIGAITTVFDAVKIAGAKLAEFVVKGFEYLKSAIGIGEGSQFGKALVSTFQAFKNTLGKFIKPFTEAFDLVKDLTSGPIGKSVSYMTEVFSKLKKPFVELASGIANFGKIFGFVAKIVEKIAMPLMIVMTVWDTVKGAIEGYEKEGIVGAISGAIKGLIESLITAPVDMLKDGIAWILNKFDFKDAAKFLEGFSVTDMMKGFVDAIFHPVDTIRSMFDGVVKFFEGIEIPKIGFTIPIINKEVSIGPFYPFKSDKPEAAKVEGGGEPTASAKATAESTAVATPSREKAIGTSPAYQEEYEKALKKTGGNERIARKLASINAGLTPGEAPDAEQLTPEQVQALKDRRTKIDALRAQDPNKGIDAELAMYEERGAKATAKLEAANIKPMTLQPMSAGAVYDQSAQNAEMAQVQQPVSNVVVAPTNVTNNKTQLPQMRLQQRNTESTFGRLSERMFAPI